MKSQLVALLVDVLKQMGVTDAVPLVDRPAQEQHGDYTTNLAMVLTKRLKRRPIDIANDIKTRLEGQKKGASLKKPYPRHSNSGQTTSAKSVKTSVLQDIDKIEVVPPGFVNFFISASGFINVLSKVIDEKEGYGKAKVIDAKIKVMVEFADPNPFKEFHIGHLRNIALGESYSRLMEATGHTVRRANYQGDVGMHVAKALWRLLQNSKFEIRNSKSKTPKEKAQLLGEAYVVGAKAYEEDQSAKQEILELNKKIYRLDPTITKDWREYRQWSLDYFDTIYGRVRTKFSRFYFESEVAPLGVKLVKKHVADNVFELSDGAIVFRGEKVGLHTRVFVTQENYATYEAKDLALAQLKYQEYPYDLSVIMTGNEQVEYFRVMLAALKLISPDLAAKTRHIPFGMVRLPQGKMASRAGNVITADWLFDQAKRRIAQILAQSDSNYKHEQQEEIAEKAAVAAVKYSMLRVSAALDIAFDLAASVSFEGDSGPYLQYTYARAKSVLRKSKIQNPTPKINTNNGLNPEERAVARLILYFPEVVGEAADNFAPNALCTYLFQLAQAFNLFYQKHTILGSDKQQVRLALTAAAAWVLHTGLHLLGIESLERM